MKPSGVETMLMSIGAIAIGMPFAAVGLFLCFTVVGIIPGFILIVMSGVPLYMVQSRSIKRNVEYGMRDHPLTAGLEKPWLDEDGL